MTDIDAIKEEIEIKQHTKKIKTLLQKVFQIS